MTMHWVHTSNIGTTVCGLKVHGQAPEHSYAEGNVDCPACLSTVVRVTCNALQPAPGPIPERCTNKPDCDGPHSWEVAA